MTDSNFKVFRWLIHLIDSKLCKTKYFNKSYRIKEPLTISIEFPNLHKIMTGLRVVFSFWHWENNFNILKFKTLSTEPIAISNYYWQLLKWLAFELHLKLGNIAKVYCAVPTYRRENKASDSLKFESTYQIFDQLNLQLWFPWHFATIFATKQSQTIGIKLLFNIFMYWYKHTQD